MKVSFVVGMLATILITACGEPFGGGASSGRFVGSNATWLWNGTTWTKLAEDNSALNLNFWKDFGGLISYNVSFSGSRDLWIANRWNGANWVSDGMLPEAPPLSSTSIQLGDVVLDEANSELLARDTDAKTIWAWSRGAWASVVSPAQWPSAWSYGTAFSYDPNQRNVMILAWTDLDSAGQIWTWDGRALKQLSRFPLSFGNSDGLSVVPDEAGHLMIIGYHGTYSWDGKTLSSIGSGFPTTWNPVRVAYNAAHQQLIAIASHDDGSADTWRWQEGSWKRLGSAPAGRHSTAAYDPELAGLVLSSYQTS